MVEQDRGLTYGHNFPRSLNPIDLLIRQVDDCVHNRIEYSFDVGTGFRYNS